jgi:hypothetical protein
LAIGLHQHDVVRASRRGFQPQGAAAREQIQAPSPYDIVPQPIEQGFPHPIRRRAQAWYSDEFNFPAAPAAADDADLISHRARALALIRMFET